MLLDLGFAFIFAIVLGHPFWYAWSLSFVVWAVLFMLLPDIDALVELLMRGRLGGEVEGVHRQLTHYPLLYIPVVILVSYFAGCAFGLLLFLCLLFHFLHDSVGTGWGIRWFGPFSLRHYKFFAQKDGTSTWSTFLVSWGPEELKKTVATYGNDNWFRDYYLRLTPILVIESVGFIVGCLVLYSVWN